MCLWTRAIARWPSRGSISAAGDAILVQPERGPQGLKSLCLNSSSAPPELDHFPLSTHGLRRGLHSCVASRLIYGVQFHFQRHLRVATQTLKPSEPLTEG